MNIFSIYDSQCGRYLATGKNSTTKDEAINEGIDYLLSDGGNSKKDEDMIKNSNLADKEAFLNSHDLTIEEHSEEIEDEN